jgi:RHS repeat-associated protein
MDSLDNGQIAVPNPDVESTWEMSYDANGNLTKDNNKGILSIAYNTLNIPVSINNTGSLRVEYLYDATGTKRQQKYYTNIEGSVSKTTDFIGNFVYENGVPAYNVYDEGRIVYNTDGTYFGEAFIKDHLGNVRVTCRLDHGAIKVRQVDSYYPFGMNIKGLSQNSTDVTRPNEYLYNGKMFQDEMGLNWLDYGARFYDPVLGRFHSVDPLAETYTNQSTYLYAHNNPIRYTDYFGLGAEDEVKKDDPEKKKKQEEEQKKKDEEQRKKKDEEQKKKEEAQKKKDEEDKKVAELDLTLELALLSMFAEGGTITITAAGAAFGLGVLSLICIPGDTPINRHDDMSKGGKQGQWDDEISPKSSSELKQLKEAAARSKDTQLLRRINKEEKRRGERNKQKRGN